MFYEFFGYLKDLAFEHFDEHRNWLNLVEYELAQYGAKQVLENHYFYGSCILGICLQENSLPPKGWKQSSEIATVYIPDRRYKLGRLAAAKLEKLSTEAPTPKKLWEALGFEIPIKAEDYRYVTPGLHISRERNYAFLEWDEQCFVLQHPEAVEVTVTRFRELTL